MTDREFLAATQEQDRAEAQRVDYVAHYTAQGVGMAAFALAMYEALAESSIGRETALEFVKAALQGSR